MKAKIIIDGKECEIVLTEDQKTEIEKISKKPVKGWEQEFDKEFPRVQVRLDDEGNGELVKRFIRTVLQAQREKDKERLLEGMEKEVLKYDISGRHYLIEQLNKVINKIYE